MPKAYLSIGSNIDPKTHVRACLQELGERYGEIEVSNIYESVAVGFEGENFLNLVVGIDTDGSLGELAESLRDMETRFGRQRKKQGGYDSRTLDIDILLFGELHGRFDGIELPRPEIANRGFVILPLADLIPEWRCPELFDGTLQSFRDSYDNGKFPLWPVEL